MRCRRRRHEGTSFTGLLGPLLGHRLHRRRAVAPVGWGGRFGGGAASGETTVGGATRAVEGGSASGPLAGPAFGAPPRRRVNIAQLVIDTVAAQVADQIRHSVPESLWDDVIAKLGRELGTAESLSD